MGLKSSDYIPFIIITSAITPKVPSIEAQRAQITSLRSWSISLSSDRVNINLSALGQLRSPKIATPPPVTVWTILRGQETPQDLPVFTLLITMILQEHSKKLPPHTHNTGNYLLNLCSFSPSHLKSIGKRALSHMITSWPDLISWIWNRGVWASLWKKLFPQEDPNTQGPLAGAVS